MSKIKKSNDEIIVIYRDGNKTIAMNKTTGEKAEAKCSPEDEFNFGVDAKLALDRLFGAPYYDATKYKIVKQDQYKVGDKVVIKSATYFKDFLSQIDFKYFFDQKGVLNKYFGKPVTIKKKISPTGYLIIEDQEKYIWRSSVIAGKLVEIESENGYAGQAEDAAKIIKAYIDAFTKHGLTREEAFELFAIAARK